MHCKEQFVCLDDITRNIEELNYVLYSPTKGTLEERKEILKKQVFRGTGITLTNEEIDRLTSYDVYHLDDFISALRDIIK